ncbi:MAG: EthD domain [Frankiales bacterium]|nr:EthD domain [Frankiales bacterium]
MEKVCVAWWRDPESAVPPLADVLVPLLADAPAVRAATVHVESPEHAELRHGSNHGGGGLLTGLASLWLDSYQDLPELFVLPGRPGAGAAWLVSESVPTPYGDAFTWAEGTRSPGLTLVTLFDKPAGLSEGELYRCWHGLHRATTAECHPFTSYVRNEVFRSLRPGAPPVRGIVTESAPDVADFLDPHRFYVSGGDPERLRANQRRVFGEVTSFIDMDTIQVAPMTEYVVRRLAPTSP